MNVNDVKLEDLGITGEDKLDQIFQRQFELMQKYHKIEEANGLLITPDVPVDLQDSRGQYRLKDFAWRITEELGEALEAMKVHPDLPIHFEEEIADALHFLVEFTILAGMPPKDVLKSFALADEDKLELLFILAQNSEYFTTKSHVSVGYYVANFVESLAVTCNTLKNKPWKQTHMYTDFIYFNEKLREAWVRFICIAISGEISADRLFELYFRKSEVNKFRQRSNY